jgi:DNA-binding XRE family transcriptional regulator
MSNGEISIYEVETGIHFDVPLSPHIDGDGAAALHPNSFVQRHVGNPVDQLVGSAMRFRRIQLDMTSDELAQAANVANAVIDDYEEGRKRAQAEHLRRIAKVLGVSPAYFFAQLERG